MLDALQRQLNDYYQVATKHDVREFLVTDPAVARALGQGQVLGDTEETLLIAADPDGLALSLYLDRGLLERMRQTAPLRRLGASQLADFWKVVEGISHFNYVVWKASRDRPVSLVELELQAEIDKFVSTMLLATRQGRDEIADRLHGWLFDDVRFRPELDEEQLGRYQWANSTAARYCRGLGRDVASSQGHAAGELRAFYRLPMADKVSRMHALVWDAAGG